MKFFLYLLLFICVAFNAKAGRVSGQVMDQNKQPLAFASITIKGTAKGTAANSAGFYSLDLLPGSYTLIAQHVGFKSQEQNLKLGKEDAIVDFILTEQQYELGNIIVKNGEDPAYGIIKNAIAKRSFYENEIKQFTADVYIKGRLQLRDYPKKILGKTVDFADGDTAKNKVLFLSETVAKYSVDYPRQKVEVLSTKVSGRSDGFGFSNPQVFSFYQNNIKLGSLNQRGFISPIADNALNFYRYKFEGSFFENGKMINRIRVTPKRTYEPLFNGYINILEEEWRIQSVQLKLYKENQIEIADTVAIEQLYVPFNGTWVIKQQTILPAIKFLGFDSYGAFVQVYDNFNLAPSFSKNYFGNTILKFYDSSNKKPSQYWDSIRPVPLIDLEIRDYIKKDSLEQARKDPRYLDSLDRIANKLSFASLLLTGQTFEYKKHQAQLSISRLTDIVSFNTVEGLVINFEPVYSKKWNPNKRNRLIVAPAIRYGFSNKHFNPALSLGYQYGKKYANSISVSGGKKVYQFDNRNPVNAYANSISTLLWERDVLKLYEATMARIQYGKGLGEGFTVNTLFDYQDRNPLFNTTQHKWRDIAGRSFEPNFLFTPHKAAVASVNIRWQPGARYIEFPDRKVLVRSRYPTINLGFTKGIKNIFKSDVDYAKWALGVSQDINLNLAGSFSYNLITGGFLQNNKSYLPDYKHYISNRFSTAAPYMQSFQLMDYYAFSNTAKWYYEQHVAYHLNGLLTNKIPAFKKLNWFLVTGNNFVYINSNTLYGEVFVGLENILKIGRVDFVQSFTRGGWQTSGVRFSIAGITR